VDVETRRTLKFLLITAVLTPVLYVCWFGVLVAIVPHTDAGYGSCVPYGDAVGGLVLAAFVGLPLCPMLALLLAAFATRLGVGGFARRAREGRTDP
jgi:hypothetical protein